MSFDNHNTEPLILSGCLTIVSGLLAPALGRVFGWWGVVVALSPALVAYSLLIGFEILRRHEDNRREGNDADRKA
jgi:hypothetical protein